MQQLIHDPKKCLLGRKKPKVDPRDLKLVHYLIPELLPPSPVNRDWGKNVNDNLMLGNDQYGDCTCAAVGHATMLFTADTGKMFTPTTQQVLSLYTTVTGEEGAAFNPNTGANDNGCVISDVLKEWRTNGFVGHGLGAYASISPTRFDLMRAAINLFGVVNIGINLPITAQSEEVWHVTDPQLRGDAAPGSWGGHSVILKAYSPKTVICKTWGQDKYVTWSWLYYYMSEAWALLSPDWVNGVNKAPSGFNLAQLLEDLKEVATVAP